LPFSVGVRRDDPFWRSVLWRPDRLARDEDAGLRYLQVEQPSRLADHHVQGE
jgi:hypothetical protein